MMKFALLLGVAAAASDPTLTFENTDGDVCSMVMKDNKLSTDCQLGTGFADPGMAKQIDINTKDIAAIKDRLRILEDHGHLGDYPTAFPTANPTANPTATPTNSPTAQPTKAEKYDGFNLAIETTSNNGAFHYDSNWWSTTSPKSDSSGNKITAAYYTNVVKKMKICMNGRCHDFTVSHGKTLREMITAGHNTYLADNKGWTNSRHNPWNMVRNGHEPYVCTAVGFNLWRDGYGSKHSCQNIQRIGFPLSQEAPCHHPGTGEGLGLKDTCHNDNLSSGRLQWSSEQNFFHAAEVYVSP